MRDAFDEGEFRPAEYRPDAELTLGPAVLVSLLLGLLLLCGFCFWMGYSVGGRDAREAPVAGQQSGAQASAPANPSRPKPVAAPQAGADRRSRSEASGANLAANAQNPGSASVAGASSAPSPAPAFGTAQAGAWMVEIATVSHQEDADVLVGALRKRGYAVIVRRNPADRMFQVQIGPFSSRNDASAARQKLINDGYNAIVQP
jgi:cell division septation protein DedD